MTSGAEAWLVDDRWGKAYPITEDTTIGRGSACAIILRDPVERFISAWRYSRQRGTVTAADMQSVQKKYKALLLNRGLYFQQVKHYLDRFPRDHASADRGLDRDLEHLPRNQFSHFFDQLSSPRRRLAPIPSSADENPR